jgi:pentatricopeptide repeat protein
MNILLEGCILHATYFLVIQIFEEFISNYHIKPDSYTILNLVKADIKSGNTESAITKLSLLKEYLFNYLIDGCNNNNKHELGKVVYKKMTEFDVQQSSVTYNKLIEG